MDVEYLLNKLVESHRELSNIELLMSIEESRIAVLKHMLLAAVEDAGASFPFDVEVAKIPYVVDLVDGSVDVRYKYPLQ